MSEWKMNCSVLSHKCVKPTTTLQVTSERTKIVKFVERSKEVEYLSRGREKRSTCPRRWVTFGLSTLVETFR